MPVVGVIGGIAPESTVDYYRRIVAQYRERRGRANLLRNVGERQSVGQTP